VRGSQEDPPEKLSFAIRPGLEGKQQPAHLVQAGLCIMGSAAQDAWGYWGVAVGDGMRSPITLGFSRRTILALQSSPPFSGRPHLIASRTYKVRGILIGPGEMVAEKRMRSNLDLAAFGRSDP
jgi:hypothetical protein